MLQRKGKKKIKMKEINDWHTTNKKMSLDTIASFLPWITRSLTFFYHSSYISSVCILILQGTGIILSPRFSKSSVVRKSLRIPAVCTNLELHASAPAPNPGSRQTRDTQQSVFATAHQSAPENPEGWMFGSRSLSSVQNSKDFLQFFTYITYTSMKLIMVFHSSIPQIILEYHNLLTMIKTSTFYLFSEQSMTLWSATTFSSLGYWNGRPEELTCHPVLSQRICNPLGAFPALDLTCPDL